MGLIHERERFAQNLVIDGFHSLWTSSPASSIFSLPILPQRGWSVGSSTFVAQLCTTWRGPTVSFSAVG
jgi:hypothetical protein